MNKNLTKPHSVNVRLDRPCGLIGVPPDAPIPGVFHNVVVVAKLTDAQYNALLACLNCASLPISQ